MKIFRTETVLILSFPSHIVHLSSPISTILQFLYLSHILIYRNCLSFIIRHHYTMPRTFSASEIASKRASPKEITDGSKTICRNTETSLTPNELSFTTTIKTTDRSRNVETSTTTTTCKKYKCKSSTSAPSGNIAPCGTKPFGKTSQTSASDDSQVQVLPSCSDGRKTSPKTIAKPHEVVKASDHKGEARGSHVFSAPTCACPCNQNGNRPIKFKLDTNGNYNIPVYANTLRNTAHSVRTTPAIIPKADEPTDLRTVDIRSHRVDESSTSCTTRSVVIVALISLMLAGIVYTLASMHPQHALAYCDGRRDISDVLVSTSQEIRAITDESSEVL